MKWLNNLKEQIQAYFEYQQLLGPDEDSASVLFIVMLVVIPVFLFWVYLTSL